jgi:hypothetical protein
VKELTQQQKDAFWACAYIRQLYFVSCLGIDHMMNFYEVCQQRPDLFITNPPIQIDDTYWIFDIRLNPRGQDCLIEK